MIKRSRNATPKVLLAIAVFGLWPSFLIAADVSITIQARATASQQRAKSGDRSVPTLTVKAGEPFSAEWSAMMPREGLTLSGATMHVFLDRENAVGPADSPKPSKDALYESALIMDLAPAENTSGAFHMAAPEKGAYLLRAELVVSGQKPGHEIFAALRLVVQ